MLSIDKFKPIRGLAALRERAVSACNTQLQAFDTSVVQPTREAVKQFSMLPQLSPLRFAYSHSLRFCSEHAGLLMVMAFPVCAAEMIHQVDLLLMQPVQAAFMTNACNWMGGALNASTNNANINTVVALTFNVLRALFVLYVGYSFVQVVKSARESEEWQTQARTPLLIIFSVAAGDFITTLLLPAAAGGAAVAGC